MKWNKKIVVIGIFQMGLCIGSVLLAQQVRLPKEMSQDHPRYLTTPRGKTELRNLMKKEPWAQEVYDKIRARVDYYTDKGPEWLTSRLMMYWKSHATDVYIKGEAFDHAGGEKAPAPTVRYTGTRGTSATYSRPKLEDIVPYMDDTKGVYFHNTTKEGRPLEWGEPEKSGRNIESVNCEIMGIAKDAAFLWWYTGDERYAALARSAFDTYMTGIYYRNVPVDLNHGHQQTLVGMSSFEVIHEDVLDALVPLYDFLYADLRKNRPEKMQVYAVAFKKFADNIIDRGVPHNNWDLYQAHYIVNIALVLEDDSCYTDRKGRQYYLDYVLNRSSIRQWSLSKLIEEGIDPETGTWFECPGYCSGVIGDLASFIQLFDQHLEKDMLSEMPLISKAVATMPQYLFPNGNMVGWGDTHPGKLRTDIFVRMVGNAQLYGKKDQERFFTGMLKCFNTNASKPSTERKNVRADIASLFGNKPLKLDSKIPAGKIEDYVTPLFYAPNVSWVVQRNGMDAAHSLMVSLNGSYGNHAHANGISMELYGKGYTLAPDAGIGTSGYSGLDYLEWYAQFPSHNTVCVDGISSYPVMKSAHAFKLRSCYPASQAKWEQVTPGISYTDLYFREPESQSDQQRITAIVTHAPTAGYYVDIFRSRKAEGGDKMHDYFYHNMGQTMTLTAVDGSDLSLQPTEELAFAGGHLYAYSYLWDKKKAETERDVHAVFTVRRENGGDVQMNMWMKGEKDREVFTALAPFCEGLSRTPGMPYDMKKQPVLTFVARQNGEAWTRPFVAVYEPSSESEPSMLSSVRFFTPENAASDFAGIEVEAKDGRKDYVFSCGEELKKANYQGMEAVASYALFSYLPSGDVQYLLGGGTLLQDSDISLKSKLPAVVTLEKCGSDWFYSSDREITWVYAGRSYPLPAAVRTKIDLNL